MVIQGNIEDADHSGEIGDGYPDNGPELPEYREPLVDVGHKQYQKRNIKRNYQNEKYN